MSHTPGPWIIWRYDPGLPLSVVQEDGDRVVADMTSEEDPEDPKDAANARLIAAAPDLLKAARGALERLEAIDLSTVTGNLRAAIAKAEGRT